jgi:DNA replication protein DnaC
VQSVDLPSGTGKSHALVGCGVLAVERGLKVRYLVAADLIETLYRGLADNTVGKVITGLLRNELILIDELGFAPLDDTGSQLLFRLVSAAYERRSLGVASHWPFEEWGHFLPVQTTAVSLLDRLLSRIRDKSRYSEAPVIPRSLISRGSAGTSWSG